MGGLKTRDCMEKAVRSKMQGWKTREWKTRHQTAGVENTGKGVYGQPNVTVHVVVQIWHT